MFNVDKSLHIQPFVTLDFKSVVFVHTTILSLNAIRENYLFEASEHFNLIFKDGIFICPSYDD